MGPEGVGNSSLSNIAGDASEGMLVTLPKRYDQVPANQPIVDALKAKKLESNRSVRLDDLRRIAGADYRYGTQRQHGTGRYRQKPEISASGYRDGPAELGCKR